MRAVEWAGISVMAAGLVEGADAGDTGVEIVHGYSPPRMKITFEYSSVAFPRGWSPCPSPGSRKVREPREDQRQASPARRQIVSPRRNRQAPDIHNHRLRRVPFVGLVKVEIERHVLAAIRGDARRLPPSIRRRLNRIRPRSRRIEAADIIRRRHRRIPHLVDRAKRPIVEVATFEKMPREQRGERLPGQSIHWW